MKQILYSLLIMLIIQNNIYAQSVNVPQVQSPNVSSLGEYGKVPVSYYTGIPDISVPLHSVKTGNLNLPISLKYHPGSVKPNKHPGWVGQGWTLDSYGVITRVRHGDIDEANGDIYYCNAGDAAVNGSVSWASDDFIKTYFVYPTYKDVQADEFFFNFFGHSGKFMYSNGKWQVFSQENIKVIFDPNVGYIDNDELGDILDNCTNNKASFYWDNTSPMPNKHYPRFFKGFTLITEDGTKYIFGGNDNSIEFTTNYDSELGYPTSQIMASGWYLTKVIDVNNNEIDFSYTRTDYPICSLGYYSMNSTAGCDFGWWSGPSFQITSSFVSTHIHGGYVIFPVYLNQITTSNETLQFNISSSSEKQYTLEYLLCPNDLNYNEQYTFHWLKDYDNEGIYAVSDDILWMKLNSININYKSGENYKNFVFSYDNSSTERLRLSSVTETDKNNVAGQTYSFNYENSQLPDYGGDQTDHWGYFNGRTLENQTITDDNYFDYKQTEPWHVTFGLLKSIVYPTGGRTEFTWQSNSYSKVVAPDRGSLLDVSATPLNYYGGGIRIEQISSYETSSSITPLLSKSYYYVLNYAGDDINNYTNSNSSGILNGIPQYNIPNVDERTSIGGTGACYGSFFSTNGFSSYGYNANGSPVGYSEVTEMNKDGSYTRYLYTNYVDYDGTEHFDRPAEHVTGWANTDVYAPSSSLECERGKLLEELDYNNNNKLVKQTKYSYTTDNNRFNKFTKRILSTQDQIATTTTDALIFTASFKDYYYRYNLMSKTQTVYDANGNDGVTTTESYTYNDYDQLQTVTQTKSDGLEMTTKYKYPTDYFITNSTNDDMTLALYTMNGKNMISTPIEKVTYNNGKITDGSLTLYKNFSSGVTEPYREYKIETAIPLTEPGTPGTNNFVPSEVASAGAGGYTFTKDSHYKLKRQYSDYSATGNLLQYNEAYDNNITYLWGYNQSYPIAKVVNATQQDVAFTGFEQGEFGNWQSTSSYELHLEAKTGLRSIRAGSISHAVTKPSYVSLWAKDGTPTISSGVLKETFSTPDGWTYFKWLVSNTGTVTVNSNQGYIDDVRLYPTDALMTTYTYDPIWGMTSQTDQNGISKFYEYDAFGRLIRIRDADRKIIQQYDYHYKSK